MSRLFESLLYGIIATVIVSAGLYAIVRYADGRDPVDHGPAVQAARRTPIPAQALRIPAPVDRAAPPVTENVVRTATRTYYLTPASASQVEGGTYDSLRRTCYDAARLNGEGEFPGMQQAACTRFADFARQKGWDTGPLPAYAEPRPRRRGEQVAIIGESQPVDAGECASLYQEEQNIEAAMRSGYQEPLGNWYRARKADVEERLWRLHCPRR